MGLLNLLGPLGMFCSRVIHNTIENDRGATRGYHLRLEEIRD